MSANYLFALLLVSPRGYRQNYQASAYIAFMILSLAIGIVLFSHLDAIFLMRQFISFSLMLFGVLLLFVRLSMRLEEFLIATVLCAVAYSLTAFYMFTYGGFSLSDVYMVKGGMREFITDWPQRYVVVLIFAFFVALQRWNRGLIWVVADGVILACIFITSPVLPGCPGARPASRLHRDAAGGRARSSGTSAPARRSSSLASGCSRPGRCFTPPSIRTWPRRSAPSTTI